MPRAKKPIVYKGPPPITRVTLDQHMGDFLAKDLGIDKKDKPHIREMVEYVERVLTTHKFQSERKDKPPTLASQIRLFESLRKSALALLKEFRPLKENYCTFVTLYSYIGLSKAALAAEARESLYPNIGLHEVPFVEPEAEYKSDLAAFSKFYNRVYHAIKILNSQKKQGRVKD